MPQKLKDFHIRKISLVSWGANDEPISLKKSADGDENNEVLIFKSNSNLRSNIKPTQGVTNMIDLKKEETPEEKKKREEEEEAKKKAEEEAKKSAPEVKKEEMIEEEKKKKEDEEKAKGEEPKGEEAKKSAPTEFVKMADVQALIEKAVSPLIKKNAELEKQVQMTSYFEKAAVDFKSLGSPKTVGPILFEIEKSDMPKETKEAIVNTLKQADRLNKEALPALSQIRGYSGSITVPESASEEIQKKAEEMVQKSAGDKPMDISEARNKVRKAFPELAKREAEEYKQGVV